MNDEERIQALHQQGRIDAAQTERLLQALGAAKPEAPPAQDRRQGNDTLYDAGDVADDARDDTVSESVNESVNERATPDPETREQPDFRGIESWVTIELLACSIRVEVDDSLDEPIAKVSRGDVEVQVGDDGWRVVQQGRQDGWLERLASGAFGSRLELRLPARTGVHLDVKAGDVELVGVPALRGHLAAGDLDASGLEAVDLKVGAGDVDLELDPTGGAHRVRLAVGDLEVRLPRGADVRVEGHVSIGDASARSPLEAARVGLVAASLQGVLGEGRARLRLDVGTGDLEVRVGGHAG